MVYSITDTFLLMLVSPFQELYLFFICLSKKKCYSGTTQDWLPRLDFKPSDLKEHSGESLATEMPSMSE